MNIAVLMTCYNRKETTLRCLASLLQAMRRVASQGGEKTFHLFLVDDGSSDGTSEAVRKWHEEVRPFANFNFRLKLIAGTGDLFWSRGMALAWKEALRCEQGQLFAADAFSHFLWLNDDVFLDTDALQVLLADAEFKADHRQEAKAAYAQLVREGACERMSAAKLNGVGRFLLSCRSGEDALEEAKMCARALIANGQSPAWRQTGYILQAQAEEAAGEFSSAIDSYAHGFAEKIRTESSPDAALCYGILLSKADRHVEADKVLKEAVSLNAKDASRRARAYLWLAKNSEAMTDYHGACAYATVVVTLFDNAEIVAEAKRILEEHAEEAK